MSHSISFSSFIEKSELVKLLWLDCVSSQLTLNISLPFRVSTGLLCLDPFFIRGWNRLDRFFFGCFWSLTYLSKCISSNSGWILKANIMTVNIYSMTTPRQVGDKSLVFVHGWGNVLIFVIIDVTTFSNLILWNRSTEIATSLLMSLLVGRNN